MNSILQTSKKSLRSPTMGKHGPESVIEAYQHLLWFWYIHQNLSLDNTRDLFRQHHPNLEIYQYTPDYPSTSTLVRAFKRWNFRKHNKPYNSDSLNKELWVYFYHWCLNDTEILSFLCRRGYPMTAHRYTS